MFPIQRFLIILLFPLLTGATYYVDTAGNDSNDGSSGSPFLTIQKGVDTATTAGDTVCVNDGTYTDGFIMGVYSGSDGSPITVKNCEGGTVTVDRAEQVSSWSDLGSNIYESNTLTYTDPDYFWKDTTWLGTITSDCNDVDAEGEWCDNGSTIKIYTTSDPDTFTYRIPIDDSNIRARNVSYVVIDGINNQYGKIGAQIGYSFTAPQGATSNVTYKNSTVAYSGSRGIRVVGTDAEPTTYTYLDNMKIHTARDIAGANGHCIKFDSNETGIHNQYGYVTNSEIYDCWYHGIQMSNGWKYGFFEGNRIYDTSLKGSGSAAGIRCGGDGDGDCTIQWNDIGTSGGADDYGSGIYIQDGVGNFLINGNKIQDHVYYSVWVWRLVATPGGGIISNNQFTECANDCIRVEDASTPVYILNNTLNGQDPIVLSSSLTSETYVRGNTCLNNSAECLIVGTTAPEPDSDYNNWYNVNDTDVITHRGTDMTLAEYQTETGNETNSLSTDPLYVDSVNGDFRLSSSSPNINAGTDLSSTFTTDFENNTRDGQFDIGAYEFLNGDFHSQKITLENSSFS